MLSLLLFILLLEKYDFISDSYIKYIANPIAAIKIIIPNSGVSFQPNTNPNINIVAIDEILINVVSYQLLFVVDIVVVGDDVGAGASAGDGGIVEVCG